MQSHTIAIQSHTIAHNRIPANFKNLKAGQYYWRILLPQILLRPPLTPLLFIASYIISRGGPRTSGSKTPAITKTELYVTIMNDVQQLTVVKKTSILDIADVLSGDYLIPVCWDEISTLPADYMGKSNSITARRDRFAPGICLDLSTFSFNFSL